MKKAIITTLIILYKCTAGLAQKSDSDSLVKGSPKLPPVLQFKTKDGVIISSDNIVSSNKSKNGLDGSKKPLVMIEGKEMNEFDLKGIDPKDVEKMEVYKGENAIMRYGEKAKDGAIVVTLKKK